MITAKNLVEDNLSGYVRVAMLKRRGVTLVEISYVISIICVLVAISIPIYATITAQDRDSDAKESLLLIRDAICIFSAENDEALPGTDGSEETFRRDLLKHLQARFPRCPVGSAREKRGVEMVNDDSAMRGDVLRPRKAWKYNYVSGEFIINFAGTLESDPETTYDQL